MVQTTSWMRAAVLASCVNACGQPSLRVERIVGGAQVNFVAVDADSIFWSECPTEGCGDGIIKRAPKQVTGTDPVAIGTGRRLIAAAGALYFDDAGGTVSRRDADGTVTTLFERADAADRGFAADTSRLYQALVVTAPSPGWEIWAIPLDGTPPALLAAEAGDAAPGDLASDGSDLYWTLAPGSDATAAGVIRRVPVGGGDAETVVSDGYRPQRLEVDAFNIYWTAAAIGGPAAPNGRLFATSKGGGQSVALAYLWGDGELASDGLALYWAGPTDGLRLAVASIPLDGRQPVTLLTAAAGNATDLTVDATDVYWTLWGGLPTENGLLRAQKR